MAAREATTAWNLLIYTIAAERLRCALRRAALLAKHNPDWHLQPRVPAGQPEGGQWMPSLVGAANLVLPLLKRLGLVAIRLLRRLGQDVNPELRRLPRRWDQEVEFPREEDFDELTRRISPPSRLRPGHPVMRFRSERELRDILGPAGPDREWHHIVEKRLAENGRFPPELIHSTDNVISLPAEVHRRVTSEMGSNISSNIRILRRLWMEQWSFEEQYNAGLILIERVLKDGKNGH